MTNMDHTKKNTSDGGLESGEGGGEPAQGQWSVGRVRVRVSPSLNTNPNPNPNPQPLRPSPCAPAPAPHLKREVLRPPEERRGDHEHREHLRRRVEVRGRVGAE